MTIYSNRSAREARYEQDRRTVSDEKELVFLRSDPSDAEHNAEDPSDGRLIHESSVDDSKDKGKD